MAMKSTFDKIFDELAMIVLTPDDTACLQRTIENLDAERQRMIREPLQRIADSYHIGLYFDDNKPCRNHGASARTEIWLGEFANDEELVAAFFHELAHCIAEDIYWDVKIEYEIQIWLQGFDLLQKHGYKITQVKVNYCLNALRTYAEYEMREYSLGALGRLQKRIHEKNRIADGSLSSFYDLLDKRHRHLYKRLESIGITTTARLLKTCDDSLALNGFAEKSILRIRDALAKHGLTLPRTCDEIIK